MSLIFDPTISLGNLLTVAGVMIAALAFVYAMRGDITLINERVHTIQQVQKQQGEDIKSIIVQAAQIIRQDERINSIEVRINEISQRLSREEGFNGHRRQRKKTP